MLRLEKVGRGTYLEVTAVEGAVRVDDHECEAPLLHVHIVDLFEGVSGLDDNELSGMEHGEPYISEVHPFLLLEGLQFGHQPMFGAARAGS
jgi:hypothetical protein